MMYVSEGKRASQRDEGENGGKFQLLSLSTLPLPFSPFLHHGDADQFHEPGADLASLPIC
jgi:hypothetical protein